MTYPSFAGNKIQGDESKYYCQKHSSDKTGKNKNKNNERLTKSDRKHIGQKHMIQSCSHRQ